MIYRQTKLITAYIVIMMLLFAPKIETYLDLSMITGLIITLFSGRGYIYMSRFMKRLFVGASFILIYNIIISMVYLTIDITFVGRMVRSLVSIIAIGMYTETNDFSKEEWLSLLSDVILLHAVIVLLTATVFVSWQENLRVISSFSAHVRQYRSTGLLTGFDIAGLVCVLGLVFTISKQKLSIWDTTKVIVFILATFFTSRFSLVLLLVTLIFYLITNVESREDRMLKVFFSIIVILCAFFTITLFAATIKNQLITISLPSQLAWMNRITEKIQYAYASSDIEDAIFRNWNLPGDGIGIMLGIGAYGGGDIGYVRIINSIGIVGLFFVIYWHIVLFRDCFKIKFAQKTENRKNIFVILFFIFVVLFMDLKNCYFFTSTYFEIMMFYILVINKDAKYQENITRRPRLKNKVGFAPHFN